MHHGTCVTHVPWCMPGSLTCGDGENVPGIPGACAPAILRIWQEAHGKVVASHKVWDGIDHPFPTFNGTTVEEWEWISNFITLCWARDNLYMMVLRWIHFSKGETLCINYSHEYHMAMVITLAWASYQTRKICGMCMLREYRERFPITNFKKKTLVIDPGKHHDTCVKRHLRHARAVMHIGIANPRWRGKRCRHSRCMRNLQICVYAKSPTVFVLAGYGHWGKYHQLHYNEPCKMDHFQNATHFCWAMYR